MTPHMLPKLSFLYNFLYSSTNDSTAITTIPELLRLQTIKAIVNSHSFKSLKSDEPRRVQVLDLYCLTRFESKSSSKGIVY